MARTRQHEYANADGDDDDDGGDDVRYRSLLVVRAMRARPACVCECECVCVSMLVPCVELIANKLIINNKNQLNRMRVCTLNTLTHAQQSTLAHGCNKVRSLDSDAISQWLVLLLAFGDTNTPSASE